MHTLFPKEIYFLHSKYGNFLTLTNPYTTLLIKIPILYEESFHVYYKWASGASKSSVSYLRTHSKREASIWL